MIPILLKLTRFPLVLTAVADSVTGYLLVRDPSQVDYGTLGLLALASALLYSAGMALNDVADAKRDATLHPERPIPSGKISRRSAAIVGGLLLLGGVASARLAEPAALLFSLAVMTAILLYDFLLKRWNALAPFGMALARGANLIMGTAAALHTVQSAELNRFGYGSALLLAMYVWFLTLISTAEDRPVGWGLKLWRWHHLLFAAFPAVIFGQQEPAAVVGAVILCGLLLRQGRGLSSPTGVMSYVRLSVLLVILFDANLLFCTGRILEGLIVAGLLVPSLAMIRLYRRV